VHRIVRNLVKLLFWFPGGEIARRLPLPIALKLAAGAGRLYGLLSRRRFAIIHRELALLLGDEAVSPTAARRACEVFARSQLELLRSPSFDLALIEKLTTIDGREHLDAALAAGRGAVLALIHFGSNQLIMPALAKRGYGLLQFGSPPQAWHDLHGRTPSRIDRAIFRKRLEGEKAMGIEFLYIDRSLRPAYRALQANRILVVALDGRAGSRFEPVPFGKRTALLAPGPVGLAYRTGAPFLPLFISLEGGRHRISIHPPLNLTDQEGKPRPPRQVLASFTGIATDYIRKRPCHYGWLLQAAWHRAPLDDPPLFEDLKPLRKPVGTAPDTLERQDGQHRLRPAR